MPFITLLGQLCQDQRILGCGMLWEVATKRWKKLIKQLNAINEQKIVKIDKELPFIN